ncbi:MAG: hypothetical protein ACREFE_17505 [Limisphaerales bacterium]
MNEAYLKIIIFFSLAFVWICCINLFFIWLVCHRPHTKLVYHFIFIGHAITYFPSLYFAFNVFEIIEQVCPFSKGQRLIFGFSIVLINLAISQAVSIFSARYFFPEKWEKFQKVRNSLFVKSDQASHDKDLKQ